MKRRSKRLLALFLCITLTFTLLYQPLSLVSADLAAPQSKLPSQPGVIPKSLQIKPEGTRPSEQISPSNNLPDLNLDEIFTPPKIKTDESPATFNVNYTLQEDVIVVDGKLGTVLENLKLPDEIENTSASVGKRQMDKLRKSALVEHELFASEIPDYEKGKIYLDKANGVAVKPVENVKLRKPGGTTASNFVSLKNPELNEVFKDFNMTRQPIELTKGNISGYANGVEQYIIKRSHQQQYEMEFPQLSQSEAGALLAYNGDMLAGMSGRSQASGRYVPKHLSDPLVEFEFPNIPLAAFDEDGMNVEVTLNGYLGIDNITVEADYDFAGDYYFAVRTGQECNLTVNAEIEGQKELIVPIYGINLDAEVARITGGLFLICRVDGNIEIVTSVTQWAKVRSGVKGYTVCFVPSGPEPFCTFDEKGVDVDVSLAGEIMMDLRGGLLLGLEVLGWECVGAAALIGVGMDCRAENNIVNIDVFFIVDIYATLLGFDADILRERYYLYRMQKPDTKGYRITFYEACAYRDSIWGHIGKWTGASDDEGVKDFKGKVYITCRRTEGDFLEKTFETTSDAKGNFVLTDLKAKGFDLRKNDFIWVSRVKNESYDDVLGEAYVTTTFPFSHITMDYADNFEDEAVGYVSKARVRKWPFEEYEDISYTGPVQLIVKNKGSGDGLDPRGVCSDGKFAVKYDFKPYHEVSAKLMSDGFEAVSWNEVQPTVDIVGKRVVETIERKEYIDSDGKPVEQRREIENFLVINKRGNRQVNALGQYDVFYYIYSPYSFCFENITGHPIVPPKEIGRDGFDQQIVPVGSNNGTSTIQRCYTTEWEWNKPAGQLQLKEDLSLQQGNLISQLKLRDDFIGQLSPVQVSFRYPSGAMKPQENHFMDIDKMLGLNSVVRKGIVYFWHEGVKIEVIDPEDIDEHGKGRKMLHINDPVAELLLMKFWSRINPADLNTLMQGHQEQLQQQLPGADQMNPGNILEH